MLGSVGECATRPVQGPGTSEVLATQLTCSRCRDGSKCQSPPIGDNAEVARQSESEAELDEDPSSRASIHDQGELPESTADQDLSEDANYR